MKLVALFSLLAAFGLAFSIDLGSCGAITSPGVYVLNQSLSGSPIPAPELFDGTTACIKIGTSDVTVDCNGFNLTGPGYGTYGANAIITNGTPAAPLSNINVINCPSITNYQGGAAIAFYFTNNGSIVNNSFTINEEGVLLGASSNITIANNNASNNINGFYLYLIGIDVTDYLCSDNVLINNTASNSSNIGFNLNTDTTLFFNNTASGSDNGISLRGTGNVLTDNIAQESLYQDFGMEYANPGECDNKISNLTGSAGRPVLFANSAVDWSNLVGSEVVLCAADGSVLDNVTASGSDTLHNNGFFILSTNGATVANSSSLGNYQGFMIHSSSGNTISNNVASDITQVGFAVTAYSPSNNITNNIAHDTGDAGFGIQSTSNSITGNTAYNTLSGFFFSGNNCHDNTIANNVAHDNAQLGFGFALYEHSNNIINNTAYNNGAEGFYVLLYSNTFTGNTAYRNSYGFRLVDSRSHDTTLTDNVAYDNANYGFYVNSLSNRLDGNIAYGNNNGFYMDSGSGSSVLSSNTAHDNGNYGLYMTLLDKASISLSGNTFYANGIDFYTSAPKSVSFSYTMDSTRFLNPSGTPESSSTISIADSMEAEDAYSISGASSPAAPPESRVSFSDKFVDISVIGGKSTIDSIAWSWSDSELLGYNKSNFELWQYDSKGGWVLLNNTPDVISNTIAFLNLAPASDYGILMNGTYFYPVDLNGANITNYTDLPRWNGTAAGNLTTQGGNITVANINGTTLTDRWAAFFGDVFGNVFLGDGSSYVYSWNWVPANGGLVCVSVNPSLSQVLATGAKGTDIDGVWGFPPSASDSGNQTFNGTNCTLSFGSVTLGNASYSDTGASGDFRTCAFKTSEPPVQKANMFFCGNILAAGTQWNGGTGNYEIIVPTEYGPSGFETYYFYLSLD